MTLQHINIEDLTVSPLNVRKYGARDCADLVTSIRSLGVLQPLLVRPSGDSFEVVAGQRRLNACRILAEEGDIDLIPCLVMAEGDDATAIEASLAENIERLPMSEVDQYKAFAKLVKEGRTVEDIAVTFGITERMVSQRLALGRLHAPILTAYRKGDLHARDVRNLTMATPKQQKAWWALVKDEDSYVPTGQRLKDWLFGGEHIPVSHALFDVEQSGLAIVTDLFGDEAYFADSEAFWPLQNAAIAECVEAYRAGGWGDVIVMDVGAFFATWDYRSTPKSKGGKVFITCTTQGEVAFHEGYLTSAEAKRLEKAEAGAPPVEKPELTKAMQNYLSLHRHAAVRHDLLDAPNMTLRLIAAHMIAGSSLWAVKADPQKAAKPEIAESLETNTAQQAFETERQAIKTLLDMDDVALLDKPDGYYPRPSLVEVFGKLAELADGEVLRVLAFLMADSLAVGCELVEVLAQTLNTDITAAWTMDDTFFDLLRDKQAINSMVAEIAGENAAKEHITASAKVQKSIIKACLDGTRTVKVKNWRPRYMATPQQGYSTRSGFADPVHGIEDIAIAAE
ncbi:ParB/RepB/Spo0J family partition protein [Shimia sp. MMG029]|uniref:ParB/RepB/Spo0J family partition protein n=1 Tax=Shimia sp. MMG029 TaxID=3021978 RepID=UPI0022FEBD38|nr:ParB/RepB/Spo0J family partition protein [Shimia sp. MMG029]MDA5556036.1 ParB/RepB/Spo0J family partition protein [Shimia sp. MMG029]